MKHNPTFINKKRLGKGVAEAWFYEDKRGMDILTADEKDNVRCVRITWGEIRKAMERSGREEPAERKQKEG